MARDDTLEDLKTGINLVEFAASYGYEPDKRESSRNSVVMRHASGDKIIVARASHGHWVYFSVRDDGDNGTIIDFIQHRKPGATLGHVRRELAAWSGALNVPRFDQPDLKPVSKDRAGVLRNWGRMSAPCAARVPLSCGSRGRGAIGPIFANTLTESETARPWANRTGSAGAGGSNATAIPFLCRPSTNQ